MTGAHALLTCLVALCFAATALAQGEPQLPEFDLQYVPADSLDAVLRGDRPGVQLSAEEFAELLRLAAEETVERQGTPLTVTLTGVDVDATISEDQLQARMIVTAESFAEGWSSIDLPLALWSLHTARELDADGAEQPAAISRRADNPAVVTWMLHGEGQHRLALDLSATLTAAGNDTVVNGGLPSAPAGTFKIHLPPSRFVELNGERIDRPGDIEAESIVSIPIGLRTELPLRFTDRVSVNLAESLTLATTTISVGVSSSQVLWTATTDLSVFGTGVDRLECVIPSSLEITQVNAEGLQAWELSDDAAAADDTAPTRITLQFRQPIQGSRHITFSGVLSVPADANAGWQVPTLEIDGVSSHVGYVAVDVATGLRLKTLEVGELRTIEPAAFPAAVDPAHTHLFQFWNQDFKLILATLPREREVHVAMTNIVDIGTDGLSLVSAIAVTPLFESMFDMEVVLPADWNITSATVDGAQVHWQMIPRAAGEHVLRIPFTTPATPGVMRSIQINAYRLPEVWPIEDEPQQLSLPAVELPQADVVEAVYGVVSDPSLNVETVGLEGLDPASQLEIDLMNARLASFGKSLTLGFVYQNSHFTGDISLSRQPSQMFVDLTSLVELTGDRSLVHWRAVVQVEGGGVKQLEVSVPEEAGTDVRFTLSPLDAPAVDPAWGVPVMEFVETPRIVQQTVSLPIQGRRTWTLDLDRRLIGRAQLTAVFQFPKLDMIAAAAVEPIPPPNLDEELDAAAAAANAALDNTADTDSDDATDDADGDSDAPDTEDAATDEAADDEDSADDSDAPTTDAAASDDEAGTSDDTTASADVTATADAATASEPIAVTQQLRSIFINDAVRTSSIVAVVGREEQHLRVQAAAADGTPLKPIDPIDVPLGDRAVLPRLVASYQSADPDWVMGLSEDRLPGEPIPTVVFDQLRLASLIGRAGEGQHQASAQVRAVGIQGLRIVLPEQSDLWSVVLDGAPVEVRQEPSAIFLPWPSSSTADQVHVLQVTWKTTGEGFSSVSTLEQVPPRFEAVTGAGDVVHVELLQQTWELIHPEEAVLISNHGEFKPSVPIEISSLLSSLPRDWAWPTKNEVLETIIALLLLVGVVGLVVLVARKNSILVDEEPRIASWLGWSVGGAAVLLLIIVMLLPSVESAREAANVGSARDDLSEYYDEEAADAEDYGSADYQRYQPGPTSSMGGGRGFGGYAAPGSESYFEDSSPLAASEPESPPMDFDADETADSAAITATPPNEGAPAGPSSGDGDSYIGGFESPDDEIAGAGQSIIGGLDFRRGSDESIDLDPGQGEYRVDEMERQNQLSGEDEVLAQIERDRAQSGQGQSGPGMPYTGNPIGQPGNSDAIRARGALLSLPIAIEVPPRSVTTAFEYVGAQSDTSQTRLSVSYVDREIGRLITWVAAAIIVLLMWLARKTSTRNKLLLALIVPAAFVGLALVIPGTWHVVLDGLLIGALIGIGLWLLLAAVNCSCAAWHRRRDSSTATSTTPSQVTAILMLGLIGILSSARAMADDVLPPTRVIVPYESLEELEQEGVQRVIIPSEDFWRLYNAAHPELETTPPPAAALVTQADFTARLLTDGQPRVQVEAAFEILTLSDATTASPGVLDVPLPLGQVPINAALIDGEPANVILRDGQLVLLLSKPAAADAATSQMLTLQFDLPAPGASSARGDFTLPLLHPTAGDVTFELSRPSDELELLIGDALEAYQIVSNENGESLRISSALKPATRFSWQVREMRGNLQSTIHADAGIAVIAGRQGLSVRHAFQVRVLQGTLSEISMTLPADGRLQQIVGSDVVGWQYDQEGDTPELTIFFRSDISQATTFSVDLFQPLEVGGAASIAVPLITLQGVSREAGMLAIYPQDDLVARAASQTGLSQINIDQFAPLAMPQLPATPAAQAFRFVGDAGRSLELALEPRELESVAHQRYGVRIAYRKLQVTLHARLTPAASPRRSVLVALPDEFLLTSVAGPVVADWFETRTADGERRLQLDLAAPQSGDVEIMLDGNLPRDVTESQTDIVLPSVLDVNEYSSELAVWVDSAFEPELADLGDWETFDRQAISAELRSLDAAEPWLVFSSEEAAPDPVSVQLARGVPRLRAESVTLVAVTETGVDYGFTFQWDVSQAAADTFIVRMPDWLAGARFEVPGLRQIQSIAAGDGMHEWRLELVEPVTGRFLVSATASAPYPSDGSVLAPNIDCSDSADPPAFELSGQLHHAMVVNLSRSRIVPDDNATIETVGRDNVTIVLREELVQQAMAIVRVREEGPMPEWNIVTSSGQQSSSDVVLKAELTTLLEMDGTWRTQAAYTVRNRGHQFLAIELPAESRVLSVMVRDLPGRTYGREIAGQTMHLVPLPATSAADLSYDVVLTVEGSLAAPLPELFSVTGEELEIPLPKVVSREQSAEFGLPVSQMLWTLHLPEGVTAEPVTRADTTNLTWHNRREFLEQSATLGISNLKTESDELIQMATDEQVSLAQRQQALESLAEINRRITVVDSSGSMLPSDLAGEQTELLMGNTIILDQNAALLQTDVTEQTISQQDIGRLFCASNGMVIAGDNRPSMLGTGAISGTFGFATRGESVSQTEGRMSSGRSVLRDQAANQGFIFLEVPTSEQMERVPNQIFDTFANPIVQQAQSGADDPFIDLGDSGTQGGLSLAMQLPLRGQQLSFSRVGGDGKLVLNFRPDSTWKSGLGWLWALIWGVAIVWSIKHIVTHEKDRPWACTTAAWPMMLLGLMGFLLLTGPGRWAGFAVLAIGMVIWAWRYREPRPASEAR